MVGLYIAMEKPQKCKGLYTPLTYVLIRGKNKKDGSN